MRILKKVLMKSTCSSLGAVLLLTFGARMAHADSISDVLTVSDSKGFSMTVQLLESQEPFGRASIVYPAQVFDLTSPGRTELSDILSISSFTVSLVSDSDVSGAEPPSETGLTPIVITIDATSDQNTLSGISDTLAVGGTMPAIKPVSILESGEPSEVTIPVPEMRVNFGDGGDTVIVSPFAVNLVSLRDQPGADVGQGTMTHTITITATSDSAVPESSTLALLALGLASAGVPVWLRSRATRSSH
jgi:hypothetical protein